MRVIAGQYRGRILDAPDGLTTRPITDRVKETLFNILGARFALPGELPDFAVLDLFSGPGSLGIEALSRGASVCTFVERDRAALQSLRRNVANLRLGNTAIILTDNAWTMRPPQPPGGFGVTFVDPPYRDAEEPWQVLDLLERLAPGMSPDGAVVFRHAAQSPALPLDRLRALRCIDEREIGRMRLLFLTQAM
jgi:16S rRNA (guanine966-N2)-methyltransferase